MVLSKWSVRIHKWVALIVGIQIFLWISGGLVMSVIPIEEVRGEHKVAVPVEYAFDPAGVISLNDAALSASITEVRDGTLGHLLGDPVWRITGTDGNLITVDALTGAVLSPIDEAKARAVADADYSRDAAIVSASLVLDPPVEYGRLGPVWQVRFDDRDNTTLYIDPDRAQIAARRSSTWRFYDFFWKLHVMDYDDGADFNHPLLITAAGAAIFVAFSGMILLFIKMRRSWLIWRQKSRAD